MWPEDEEDDELVEVAEEDDGDEDAVIERVEAAFRQEHARIRAATNREWLHRLRADYEAEIADLALVGVAAARAHDLIDLIYERLAELEAAEQRRLRVAEDAAAAARQRAEMAARERRHREEAARRQTEERDRREKRERERARPERAADRRGQDRTREAEAEQRAAAARLANAKAAEIEARAAVLRAQAARAERQQAPRASRPASRSDPVPSSRARRAAEADRAVPSPSAGEAAVMSPMEQADRDALIAVGHWPLVAPPRDSILWSPDAGWPEDWTLKGMDLASLRGRLGVTQAVMAGHLGVPTVEVARAEAEPRAKVRPALQLALKRAIDEFLAANARRAVVAPLVATGQPQLTGADLAAWRSRQGLTQQLAADRLGVGQGAVSKAESRCDDRLGPALRDALARELEAG